MINKAVVRPVYPMNYAYPPENDFVANLVSKHPNRLWGFGRVDPHRPDCKLETERCLVNLGLSGIYLHLWENAFSIADPIVDQVMGVCLAHSAAVMVASGYPSVSEALQVAELARRFP